MALPVQALSVSSITTLRKCPTKWKRRYIDHDYEPASGPMLIGKAAGAAEVQSDFARMESEDGTPLSTDEVLDAYSDEFDDGAEDDTIDWSKESKPKCKDSGAATLRVFHEQVIPATPKPIAIEREARLQIEEIEFVGYLDVEDEAGKVVDRKFTGSRWSQAKADLDFQATAYLAIRRAEDDPATGFEFHTGVRLKSPVAEVLQTERTDDQLDHFLLDVLGAAKEIEWRIETDNWSFAPPGAWWCGERSCGYFDSCPAGGLHRKQAAKAARNGGGK